jgi:hypothetical protein
MKIKLLTLAVIFVTLTSGLFVVSATEKNNLKTDFMSEIIPIRVGIYTDE